MAILNFDLRNLLPWSWRTYISIDVEVTPIVQCTQDTLFLFGYKTNRKRNFKIVELLKTSTSV